MKQILLMIGMVALVGCGKKEPVQPSASNIGEGSRSVPKVDIAAKPELAKFIIGKRIHFQIVGDTQPVWAEFTADGKTRHSARPNGTYKVDGLKIFVKDAENVLLTFTDHEVNPEDTFEARVVGTEMFLKFNILKVEPIPAKE